MADGIKILSFEDYPRGTLSTLSMDFSIFSAALSLFLCFSKNQIKNNKTAMANGIRNNNSNVSIFS
jgi:hypothetical protein